METENLCELQKIENELRFGIEKLEITQTMILAANSVDVSVDEVVVRKILEIGLPYRTGSLDAVSKVVKGVSQDVIDDMLDTAIAAIE